ncbi:hypothetical protein GGR52DRAFT_455700 [Hypoxylon sp. FL1284]|nr:hypothetical protein GGR52DRAFT_455700 [Hypoxylon sp. FL1284]
MRLDVSVLGILACLAGLAAAGDDINGGVSSSDGEGVSSVTPTDTSSTAAVTSSPNMVIQVQPLKAYPIYVAGSGNQSITYGKAPGVTNLLVTGINLKRYDDNVTIAEGIAQSGVPPSISTDSGVGAVFHSDEAPVGRRDAPVPIQAFQFTMTQDSITVSISPDLSEYGQNAGQPLYYEFEWANSTAKGTSYSQLIAVTIDSEIGAAMEAIKATGKETNPAEPEAISELFPSDDPISSTPSSSPAAGTSEAAAESHDASGSGGLSTGAIVGIAVGCSVGGLLIIALLAWFCIFRRRGSRDRSGDFAPDSSRHAMISTDKDAVVMSQSSPRSTFADGGRRRNNASATPGDDAASYAPYASNRGRSTSPPAFPPAVNGSQTDVASTTRSPSPPCRSRYAHLIEEGMTEDEIRWLEEEERHLDAAIEDAGRSSRMTR